MDDKQKKAKDLLTRARDFARRPLTPEQLAVQRAMLEDAELLKGTIAGLKDIEPGRVFASFDATDDAK